MADDNLDVKKHKTWVIVLIVVAVALALFYFYKMRGERQVIETAPPASIESSDQDRSENLEPISKEPELVPDYELLDEPGKTHAEEGVKLYIEEKYEEAKEFLEKAAKEGNAEAKALLGKMYVLGRGGVQDVKKGLEYLEDAVEHGSSYAMAELGKLYVEGKHGVEKATDKGLDLIHRSIDKGQYYGHLAMARLHEAGEGVEHSVEKAIEYLKQAGERGYRLAAEEIEKLKEKLKEKL